MEKRTKKAIKIETVNETTLNYEKATRYFMDFVGEEFDIYAITSIDVDNYIADCLERLTISSMFLYLIRCNTAISNIF